MDDADPDAGVHPIGGTPLVKTAALASVPADRLSPLLVRVQRSLNPRLETYRRRYERIECGDGRESFLVESDHWVSLGVELQLADRERDAAQRAHETAVIYEGTRSGRRDELETALEIRSAVVIGTASRE
jgi:hypothetical protein